MAVNVTEILDSLAFHRAKDVQDKANEMADILTQFGVKTIGVPIDVLDADGIRITYGVLITEESFDALTKILADNLKGKRYEQ